MKQFRLYLGRTTGDKLIPQHPVKAFIRDVIDPLFDAFTVFDGQGRWKGKSEPSVVVEVITDETNRPAIDHIAASYASTFHQDAVLVTSQDVVYELVQSRDTAVSLVA